MHFKLNCRPLTYKTSSNNLNKHVCINVFKVFPGISEGVKLVRILGRQRGTNLGSLSQRKLVDSQSYILKEYSGLFNTLKTIHVLSFVN